MNNDAAWGWCFAVAGLTLLAAALLWGAVECMHLIVTWWRRHR